MTRTIATTEIGSLPTIHIDAALEHAFRVSIPFFPQLPNRSPREFMIAQALDGLTGLTTDADGTVSVVPAAWEAAQPELSTKLDQDIAHALSPYRSAEKLEAYEPRSESASCWRPFLFELEERKIRRAKIQIAGPITSQWSVAANSPSVDRSLLQSTIVRFVLLRALAMSNALRLRNVQPVLFLDEPGLAMFDPSLPGHRATMQELTTIIQTLKQQEITVGLHCCGQTDWPSVLKLPLDYLSIDAALSGAILATHRKALETFFDRGGQLALGLVPTNSNASNHWAIPDWIKPRVGLLTPACGLALLGVDQADAILDSLGTL